MSRAQQPFQFSHRPKTMMPLLHVLRACMIRHTKLQVLGGEEVLSLPPKTEELVPGGSCP